MGHVGHRGEQGPSPTRKPWEGILRGCLLKGKAPWTPGESATQGLQTTVLLRAAPGQQPPGPTSIFALSRWNGVSCFSFFLVLKIPKPFQIFSVLVSLPWVALALCPPQP